MSTDLEKYSPVTPGFKRRIAAEILLEAVKNGPAIDKKLNKVSEGFLLVRSGVMSLLLLGFAIGLRGLIPWTCRLKRDSFWGFVRLVLCPQ